MIVEKRIFLCCFFAQQDNKTCQVLSRAPITQQLLYQLKQNSILSQDGSSAANSTPENNFIVPVRPALSSQLLLQRC